MILQEQVDVRDVDPDGVDVDDRRHVQDLLLLPEKHAGPVLHLRIPPGLYILCFVCTESLSSAYFEHVPELYILIGIFCSFFVQPSVCVQPFIHHSLPGPVNSSINHPFIRPRPSNRLSVGPSVNPSVSVHPSIHPSASIYLSPQIIHLSIRSVPSIHPSASIQPSLR